MFAHHLYEFTWQTEHAADLENTVFALLRLSIDSEHTDTHNVHRPSAVGI